MKLFSALLSVLFVFAATSFSALASDYKLGDLAIHKAYIPATVKSAPVAAGYLKITNNGKEDDRLVSVKANFSAKQQIHTMKMVDGIMRMRPLKDGIVIPGGGETVLKSGGDHLMFMKLFEPMQIGQMREVTLVFEKAGEVTIVMPVVDPSSQENVEGHDHSGHSEHSEQTDEHSTHSH